MFMLKSKSHYIGYTGFGCSRFSAPSEQLTHMSFPWGSEATWGYPCHPGMRRVWGMLEVRALRTLSFQPCTVFLYHSPISSLWGCIPINIHCVWTYAHKRHLGCPCICLRTLEPGWKYKGYILCVWVCVCVFGCVLRGGGEVTSDRVQMSRGSAVWMRPLCAQRGETRWRPGLRRLAIWMDGIQDGRMDKLSMHTQNNALSFSLLFSHSLTHSLSLTWLFIILFPILFALWLPMWHFHCDEDLSWALWYVQISGIPIPAHYYWETFRCVVNHRGQWIFYDEVGRTGEMKNVWTGCCSSSDLPLHCSNSLFQQLLSLPYTVKHTMHF